MCVQEQPLGGPRIKHVCRAAAVALGQPRAMVPDDIPRLSALPLHEREGISFSPTVEGRHNSNKSCIKENIRKLKVLAGCAREGAAWQCVYCCSVCMQIFILAFICINFYVIIENEAHEMCGHPKFSQVRNATRNVLTWVDLFCN